MELNFFKKHKIYAPWEKAFHKVATPFEHFLHKETTTGLVLVFMTIVALYLANSPYSEAYAHFFHTHLTISFGSFVMDHSIHHWINDGLMALFFFLIGLEIKREVLVGELSEIKNAILPIIAAFGGVLVPAVIYYSINQGFPGENGWGIPMATDIAFAITALVLLGRRVPIALITFLVALAIVDDLIAVGVIAIFYTEQIQLIPLMMAMLFFLVVIAFNKFGIHSPIPYFIVGGFMWIEMMESGVHATIAGILTAMAIPAKPKFDPEYFDQHMARMSQDFGQYPLQEDHELHDNQKATLHQMEDAIHAVQSPLNRLEHHLHLPIGLIIIPLFALANAGIALDMSSMNTMAFEPVVLGVFLGLLLGKVIGIAGTAYLAIKLGIAKLPNQTTMSQIFGVSFLGGIGFTMSIFIAELAFKGQPDLLLQAKTGVLFASIIAGAIGFIWLKYITKPIHH